MEQEEDDPAGPTAVDGAEEGRSRAEEMNIPDAEAAAKARDEAVGTRARGAEVAAKARDEAADMKERDAAVAAKAPQGALAERASQEADAMKPRGVPVLREKRRPGAGRVRRRRQAESIRRLS